jgi:hypothetical protein
MKTAIDRPAFRKPWEHGARAYHEADSLAAALEGFKRVRTIKSFILKGTTDDPPCGGCGRLLSDDPAELDSYKGNRCQYHPRTKSISVRHYTCAWGDTLAQVQALAERF